MIFPVFAMFKRNEIRLPTLFFHLLPSSIIIEGRTPKQLFLDEGINYDCVS